MQGTILLHVVDIHQQIHSLTDVFGLIDANLLLETLQFIPKVLYDSYIAS